MGLTALLRRQWCPRRDVLSCAKARTTQGLEGWVALPVATCTFLLVASVFWPQEKLVVKRGKPILVQGGWRLEVGGGSGP